MIKKNTTVPKSKPCYLKIGLESPIIMLSPLAKVMPTIMRRHLWLDVHNQSLELLASVRHSSYQPQCVIRAISLSASFELLTSVRHSSYQPQCVIRAISLNASFERLASVRHSSDQPPMRHLFYDARFHRSCIIGLKCSHFYLQHTRTPTDAVGVRVCMQELSNTNQQ